MNFQKTQYRQPSLDQRRVTRLVSARNGGVINWLRCDTNRPILILSGLWSSKKMSNFLQFFLPLIQSKASNVHNSKTRRQTNSVVENKYTLKCLFFLINIEYFCSGLSHGVGFFKTINIQTNRTIRMRGGRGVVCKSSSGM